MKICMVDALITIAHKRVVLIRRAKPPFMEKLVMPGGHVEVSDVSLEHACARELREEIGLTVDPVDLRFLILLDGEERDPRKPTQSTVFTLNFEDEAALGTCQAGSDARAIVIREIAELTPEDLGFDHFLAILALNH